MQVTFYGTKDVDSQNHAVSKPRQPSFASTGNSSIESHDRSEPLQDASLASPSQHSTTDAQFQQLKRKLQQGALQFSRAKEKLKNVAKQGTQMAQQAAASATQWDQEAYVVREMEALRKAVKISESAFDSARESFQRELDHIKKENDLLKQRIRQLQDENESYKGGTKLINDNNSMKGRDRTLNIESNLEIAHLKATLHEWMTGKRTLEVKTKDIGLLANITKNENSNGQVNEQHSDLFGSILKNQQIRDEEIVQLLSRIQTKAQTLFTLQNNVTTEVENLSELPMTLPKSETAETVPIEEVLASERMDNDIDTINQTYIKEKEPELRQSSSLDSLEELSVEEAHRRLLAAQLEEEQEQEEEFSTNEKPFHFNPENLQLTSLLTIYDSPLKISLDLPQFDESSQASPIHPPPSLPPLSNLPQLDFDQQLLSNDQSLQSSLLNMLDF